MLEELRALGAGPDVIDAAKKQQQQEEDFELFEDCALSVEVFSRMQTQWQRNDGKRVGLVYASLVRVMQRCGVAPEQENQVFDDVQLMEIETLVAVGERDQ